MVTGQAPVTLELRNTPGKSTNLVLSNNTRDHDVLLPLLLSPLLVSTDYLRTTTAAIHNAAAHCIPYCWPTNTIRVCCSCSLVNRCKLKQDGNRAFAGAQQLNTSLAPPNLLFTAVYHRSSSKLSTRVMTGRRRRQGLLESCPVDVQYNKICQFYVLL